jgi:hypothetical protein
MATRRRPGDAAPLGIACRCGHRAVIELASLGITSGDMRSLRDLPFVCSSCGSQQGFVARWKGRGPDVV